MVSNLKSTYLTGSKNGTLEPLARETTPEVQPESLEVSSTLEQGMNFEIRHSNSVMFGPTPRPRY